MTWIHGRKGELYGLAISAHNGLTTRRPETRVAYNQRKRAGVPLRSKSAISAKSEAGHEVESAERSGYIRQ